MLTDCILALSLSLGVCFVFFVGWLRPGPGALGRRPSRTVLHRAFRRAARRLRAMPAAGTNGEADVDPFVLHGARLPRRYSRR